MLFAEELYDQHQKVGCVYPFLTPIANFIEPIATHSDLSGVDEVDCIYVINLDRRTDRWQRMEQILNQNLLHANRVSGFDGRYRLTESDMDAIVGPYGRRNIKKGQVGIVITYLSILKHALDNNFNCIWVMEDDVEFHCSPESISKFLVALSNLDPDWDLFYTNINHRYENNSHISDCHWIRQDQRPDDPTILPDPEYFPSLQLARTWFHLGTSSSIFSKKGVKKIFDFLTHIYFWSGLDIDIHHLPNIHEYISTIDLVGNWPFSDSDTWPKDDIGR